MIDKSAIATAWTRGLAVTAALLLAGCATTDTSLLGSGAGVTASDPTRLTQSGFLSNYGRLKPVSWADGIQCWRAPNLDVKQYDKVLIARMKVSLKPGQQQEIDPTDLKTLTDYFHGAMAKALAPQMKVVDKPGRGVLGLRIALTNLVPTQVSRSVTGTLVPYAFVAEAGSGVATGRPAGSTPYLGETAMEMQFVDGASGTVLAECRDTEIGRKYAADLDAGAAGAAQTWASGYVNSFQSWAYAKNAFDKWATLTAERLAALRAAAPAP
ncbi:DUF3313 domain-containing protein [Thiocystis violacea]|uniref:DUF3313 domain-containing protein n=1 Tax=Thiocystis violacea TaxID=13725 RepID=UPI0019057ECD|nr:DUF3313 domain-containing protein [Thiocystis violacea]MBK1725184.1 DUF3313 domain-containing protein [Thiocystis violacea]